MITVKNVSQGMLSFDLAHDVVCRASGICTCKVVNRRATTYPPGKGTGGYPTVRMTPVKIPKGVHLAPGEKVDCPDAAAELHQVQAMKAAGKIEIKVVGAGQQATVSPDDRPRRRGGK